MTPIFAGLLPKFWPEKFFIFPVKIKFIVLFIGLCRSLYAPIFVLMRLFFQKILFQITLKYTELSDLQAKSVILSHFTPQLSSSVLLSELFAYSLPTWFYWILLICYWLRSWDKFSLFYSTCKMLVIFSWKVIQLVSLCRTYNIQWYGIVCCI